MLEKSKKVLYPSALCFTLILMVLSENGIIFVRIDLFFKIKKHYVKYVYYMVQHIYIFMQL